MVKPIGAFFQLLVMNALKNQCGKTAFPPFEVFLTSVFKSVVPHRNIKWTFHCYVLITPYKTEQDNNTHTNTYLSIMSLRSLADISVSSIKQPRFVRRNTLPFCNV